MRTRRFVHSAALVLAASLAMTACSGSGEPTTPSDSPADDGSVQSILNKVAAMTDDKEREAYLVTEAAKHGQTVIYTTQNTVLVDKMNTKIDEDYPDLDIEFVHLSPGEAVEKVLAESSGGSPVFSVAQMDAAATSTFVQEKVLASYDSPLRAPIDPSLKDEDGYYVANTQIYYVMGYNTDLIDDSQLPDTWEEFAKDAKLDGKVARTDVGGATRWVAAILDHYGEKDGMKILQGLADQKPRLFDSNPAMWDALVSGQIAVGYDTPIDFLINYQNDGAPIGYHIVEPVFRQLQYSSISAEAPNPYGAALVVDWLLSANGAHTLYNSIPIGGVNPNVHYIHEKLFDGVELATYDVASLKGDPNHFADIFVDLFH